MREDRNRAGVEVVEVDGRYWAVRPHWLGELVTCPWCAGFWVAAGVVAARSWLGFWPILGTVLAISAVVGLLARIE